MAKKKAKTKKVKNKKKGLFFRFIRRIVRFFYGKKKLIGVENIPTEPCVVVGNHSQMSGPLFAELRYPYKKYTWAIGQLMNNKEAPAYAYKDFWGYKPKRSQWFYKGLAKIVAPLLVYIHKNADTIAVYKDNRGLSTFKKSIKALKEGAQIILFPECHTPFNHIVNEFQDKFIDLARLYHKDTGKELQFVPMYIAPKLKTVTFGKPIKYDCNLQIDEQRKVVCDYLKTEITSLAEALPLHTVVPYANIKKKLYPKNKLEQTE